MNECRRLSSEPKNCVRVDLLKKDHQADEEQLVHLRQAKEQLPRLAKAEVKFSQFCTGPSRSSGRNPNRFSHHWTNMGMTTWI